MTDNTQDLLLGFIPLPRGKEKVTTINYCNTISDTVFDDEDAPDDSLLHEVYISMHHHGNIIIEWYDAEAYKTALLANPSTPIEDFVAIRTTIPLSDLSAIKQELIDD